MTGTWKDLGRLKRSFTLSYYNKVTIWLVFEVLQYTSQTLYLFLKSLDFLFTISNHMRRQFHLRQKRSFIPSITDSTSAERRGGFSRVFWGTNINPLCLSFPASHFMTFSFQSLSIRFTPLLFFSNLFSYIEQWRWIASTLLTTPESDTATRTSMVSITVYGSYLCIALTM